MRVGIDFDNTIAAYDHLFRSLASEWHYLPDGFSGGKIQLRKLVRSRINGETDWMRLQGQVYGALMLQAEPLPGVVDFIRSCRNRCVDVFIISHKTEYGHFDSERVNLRQAARQWLSVNGFFDCDGAGLDPENVFFEATRGEKMARIGTLGCTHFIDDLKEVFNETSFPDGVARILLSMDSGKPPEGPFRAFGNWRDISNFVFAPFDIARKLIRSPVTDIAAVGHGGNNRVYRVQSENDVFALKAYPALPGDDRDRMGVEFESLEFFHNHAVASVPKPLASARMSGFALYSWIDGVAVDSPVGADIDAALTFLGALHDLCKAEGARGLRPASQACLSGAELSRQILSRIVRLRTVSADNPKLADFIEGKLTPAVKELAATARVRANSVDIDFDAELDLRYQTLSPSDFGFHNMLRQADGRLAFVDFEYFGWDDPAKMVNDFILHPAMQLSGELEQQFVTGAGEIFSDDPAFIDRLSILYPLYVLRWCTILLNEFLPDHWARRVYAGAGDRETVCQKQLEKARRMLQRLANSRHDA